MAFHYRLGLHHESIWNNETMLFLLLIPMHALGKDYKAHYHLFYKANAVLLMDKIKIHLVYLLGTTIMVSRTGKGSGSYTITVLSFSLLL